MGEALRQMMMPTQAQAELVPQDAIANRIFEHGMKSSNRAAIAAAHALPYKIDLYSNPELSQRGLQGLYRPGYLGRPSIEINPNNMDMTTLPHEAGHALIASMPQDEAAILRSQVAPVASSRYSREQTREEQIADFLAADKEQREVVRRRDYSNYPWGKSQKEKDEWERSIRMRDVVNTDMYGRPISADVLRALGKLLGPHSQWAYPEVSKENILKR